MNWQRTIFSALLLFLCSCSQGSLLPDRAGQPHPDRAPQLTATTDAGILRITAQTDGLPDFRGSLPAPAGVPDDTFLSFSEPDYLALVHVSGSRLDLCLAARGETLPHSVLLETAISQARPVRESSIAAPDNRVSDLLVLRTTDNYYRLTWTATNIGDYDHNGEVNVADLIPLARYLGESAPAGSPWTRQQAQYYVDGDGNNTVSISDITPIARNYGNLISYYVISSSEGLLLSTPFSDGIFDQASGLPPRFNVLISAESVSSAEDFSIVTIGPDGRELAPPSSFLSTADLSVVSEFDNLELFALCADQAHAASGSASDPCNSVLRIIDPIDDIGSWEPPSDFIPEFGMTLFNNLKRGKLCYLETRFLPVTDPASGNPNAAGGADSPEIQRISYPIRLPDDGSSYEAHVRIAAVDYPGDGVYLDVFADSSIPGRVSALPIRLHPALDRVARDLDADGDFDDESWLRDSDHNSLSDSLEEKLRTDDQYFISHDIQVVGTVQDIRPESGELVVANALEYCDDSQEDQHDLLTIHYTELTQMSQSNPLNQGLDPQKIRSSDISPGLQVAVTCSVQRLTEFGEAVNFWATDISQSEPFGGPDSISIVPALTARRPGQVVNVTVYANHTAEAFNSLELMTLHIRGAGEVVAGSINPGVQGGADDEADGIWQLLGPDALTVDANVYGMGFQFGKYFQNLDVGISSQSSLNLSHASGALFNFDLRIYEPVVVLAGYRFQESISRYADAQGNSYDWISQPDEDSLYIELKAPQPTLTLFDAALSGDGSYFDPYIIEPGQPYRLQVLDELDGDITSNPNTWYVVDPTEVGTIIYNDPVIELPPGFEGFTTVHVLYPGKLEIPGAFARKVYFHTP